VGQTIACTNQKGGVGKTTTVVNLATYLALLGDRVLVIDLDPQGNATSGFGVDRQTVGASTYESLVEHVPLGELHVATPVPGLRLVPASIALAGAEVELASQDGRERRLRRAVQAETGHWDWILIDCPPSLGLLTVNALTGADAVLIPIQCEYYALEGLTQLIATVNLVRDHLNPDLEIAGVVLTMFDGRTNLSTEVATEVRRHLHGAVFDTIVPRSVRLSEAPSHGLPIALYRPESKGAEAYNQLAVELRARRGPGTRVAAQLQTSPTSPSRDDAATDPASASSPAYVEATA
jgi:chromosome partitioning protein